jgi:hypothetical protein
VSDLRQPYTLVAMAALLGAVLSAAAALGLAIAGSWDVHWVDAVVQAQIEDGAMGAAEAWTETSVEGRLGSGQGGAQGGGQP